MTDELLNLELLRWRLAEVIAWCAPRVIQSAPATCLRSPELRPHHLRPVHIFDSDPGVGETWSVYVHSQSEDTTRTAVAQLVHDRAWLLKEAHQYPAHPAADLAQGRLILAAPECQYFDGASEFESAGYIDVGDLPPWDTVLGVITGDAMLARHFYPSAVLAWVPPPFVALVDAGIHVSFVDTLAWLSEVDCALATQVRQAGLT